MGETGALSLDSSRWTSLSVKSEWAYLQISPRSRRALTPVGDSRNLTDAIAPAARSGGRDAEKQYPGKTNNKVSSQSKNNI